MKNIIVIGTGGHAHSVCDMLLAQPEFRVAGLVGPDAAGSFMGLPVLCGDECLPELLRRGLAEAAFVAVGDNALRRRLTALLEQVGFPRINVISPHAVVSPTAVLGCGVAVMPGAVIHACARVGDGCIVNTNASLDHDDIAGPFCHIAPGATVCGTVTLGEGCFIGAGARIIDRLTIGAWATVGAGAAVLRDLPAGCTAVGVPARIIKKEEPTA